MSTKKKSGSSRATKAKQKAAYVSDEEEEAFTNNYDILDKLESKKFPKYFIQEMTGEEVTLEHFQRQGFNSPIYVPEKAGLHIKVPDSSFTVTDVRNLVGGKRVLEVRHDVSDFTIHDTLSL